MPPSAHKAHYGVHAGAFVVDCSCGFHGTARTLIAIRDRFATHLVLIRLSPSAEVSG